MSNAKAERVNDEYTEWKNSLSMAEPAAKFLLRALRDLRLVDDTITVEDLHDFADEVRKGMGLMIGTKKQLKEIFDIDNQVGFHEMEAYREAAGHLSEKILQAQQKLIASDRDFPF